MLAALPTPGRVLLRAGSAASRSVRRAAGAAVPAQEALDEFVALAHELADAAAVITRSVRSAAACDPPLLSRWAAVLSHAAGG